MSEQTVEEWERLQMFQDLAEGYAYRWTDPERLKGGRHESE
jgi:hypothetical protein